MKKNSAIPGYRADAIPLKTILWILCPLLVLPLNILHAACADDISDVPVETRGQTAPANIMFVLDNSDSMDWEFMTPQAEGIFQGKFYLYPDAAFVNSTQDRIQSDAYILNPTERRIWIGQWSGYNKLFYTPHVPYDPWPLKANADNSRPWSNPNNTDASSARFKMEGEYYAVTAGSGGSVSVKNAHYFVVNDLDDDGEKDAGEDIYLVNFVSGVRAWYLFADHDSDDTVDDGELFLKTGASVPSRVKAGIYEEDGTLSGYATDAQDLQNWANWFSYYRKRALTVKAAVAGAIDRLNRVYVGYYSINPGLRQTVLPVGVEVDIPGIGESASPDPDGSTAPSTMDETDTLLAKLYAMDAGGSTPLRTALENVGRYLDRDDGSSGNLGDSPYASAAGGGACQQAFAIVMTDGFWNGDVPSVGNADADTSNGFDGPPYEDRDSDTLADVAMYYYKRDLASDLDNVVPTNACDQAGHQHMVTYAVSFGVNGNIDPDRHHSCLLDGSSPPWPGNVDTDAEKIDDLYHASVNGRGLFFSAGNPQELVRSLVDVSANIASRISTGASVSINGEALSTGSVLFQTSYDSDNWTGDVIAYPVDPDTGGISKKDIVWRASDRLRLISATSRNIVTFDPLTGGGTEFLFENLDTEQKANMHPDPTTAEKVVRYIRGEEISGFRTRNNKLGDIVHSAPLFVDNTVYTGANDGMLHAFNARTGEERFAYVPNLVMDNFYNSTDPDASFYDPGYQHRYFVDLTPVSRSGLDPDGDNSHDTFTYLVGGLGKGGRGYFCLDITHADSLTSSSAIGGVENMVKWEYPGENASADEINSMGYAYSMPIIVRTNLNQTETDPSSGSSTKAKWAVIFGNGYGSASGGSALFIVDLRGRLIRKIDTGALGCNGLSTPSVVDADNDLRADYAYAGDLQGNLWKFDLTSDSAANWTVAYKDGPAPAPLFSVTGRAITGKPDVMYHCEHGKKSNLDACANSSTTAGYMVSFGTGRFLSDADRTSTASEYVFGLWDYGDDDSEYLGTFDKTASPQLSNMDSRITLLEQKEEVSSGYYNGVYLRILTANRPSWKTACDPDAGQNPDPAAGANAGWFVELNSGERVIKDVSIRDNKLIYLTFTPDTSPCSSGGSSIIHQADACSGGRLDSAQFDINNDRTLDEGDLPAIEVTIPGNGGKVIKQIAPTGIRRSGLINFPFIVRLPEGGLEMIIFSGSDDINTMYSRPEPRGMFYWRNY